MTWAVPTNVCLPTRASRPDTQRTKRSPQLALPATHSHRSGRVNNFRLCRRRLGAWRQIQLTIMKFCICIRCLASSCARATRSFRLDSDGPLLPAALWLPGCLALCLYIFSGVILRSAGPLGCPLRLSCEVQITVNVEPGTAPWGQFLIRAMSRSWPWPALRVYRATGSRSTFGKRSGRTIEAPRYCPVRAASADGRQPGCEARRAGLSSALKVHGIQFRPTAHASQAWLGISQTQNLDAQPYSGRAARCAGSG